MQIFLNEIFSRAKFKELRDPLEFMKLINQIDDPNSKFCIHLVFWNLRSAVNITKGKFLKTLLKDRAMLQMEGVSMQRNHPFFEEFDRKFQQLFTGGLINQYTEEYFETLNPKRYEHLYPGDEPQVLTMKHLEAGFVVWLVSLSFAIIEFIIEWIIQLEEYLVIKFILSTFYAQTTKL